MLQGRLLLLPHKDFFEVFHIFFKADCVHVSFLVSEDESIPIVSVVLDKYFVRGSKFSANFLP